MALAHSIPINVFIKLGLNIFLLSPLFLSKSLKPIFGRGILCVVLRSPVKTYNLCHLFGFDLKQNASNVCTVIRLIALFFKQVNKVLITYY